MVSACTVDRVAYGVAECFLSNGFVEDDGSVGDRVGVGVAGHEDDGQAWISLGELSSEVGAGDTFHHDVGEDEIDFEAGSVEHGEGFVAVADGDDLVSE